MTLLFPACARRQAVELDELQRDSSDVFALRQQLASARAAEAQLRQQVQQLQAQVAGLASRAASSGGSDAGGDASPRSVGASSARSSGAASPPRTTGRQGAAALQGRVEAAGRELATAKQEVR